MSRLRRRLAHPALALGAGFVVALAMPPWGFWPLAFAGVALFELSLGVEPSPAARWWRGFLFGFGWLAMGMGWMWQLTVPGYIAASLVFAAFHGLAALVAPTGRWRVIGRPAAHTLVEALRFSWPFGGVPLASMGIGQAGGPLIIVARVGGVILLTWVVFQLGFALGAVVDRTPVQRRDWPAFGAAAGVVVVIAAGDRRSSRHRHRGDPRHRGRPGRRAAGHDRARRAEHRGHQRPPPGDRGDRPRPLARPRRLARERRRHERLRQQRASTAGSPTRHDASACRSPSA